MSEKTSKKERALRSKAELLKASVFLFCFILFILLAFVVVALLYTRDGQISQGEKVEVIDPDEYFKDCQLLESKCLDIGCNYYSRCGDGQHAACRVYDCGQEIGVYTEDAEGRQKAEKQPRRDPAVLEEKKISCRGTMEKMSDECVGGEEKIKVKIVTEGECEITAFAVVFDGTAAKSNTFASLGNNIYEITAHSCGNVTRIVPATKGGVSLQF